MSSILRQGFRALAQPLYHQTSAPINTSIRCMSVDGIKSFRDREASAENLYFNKEEERLLRNMLKKMKSQADKHDEDAAIHNTEEGKQLEAIVSKYNMSEEDFKALMQWKHS